MTLGRRIGRPALTGGSAGCLSLGVDYLAHALLQIPLFPEQAGDLLLRVLPLPVFSALLRTFSVLARPLLLLGATVVIIAGYALGAALAHRLTPRLEMPVLLGLVLLVAGSVAFLNAGASVASVSLLVEVVILLAGVPVAYEAVNAIADAPDYDQGRRRTLRTVFAGGVGLALIAIGVVDVRRFITALAMKEGDRAQTELTPVDSFYVVSKNLSGDPQLDPATWRLQMPGVSLAYSELLALPAQEVELTLECISNEVGGNLISNGRWRGPRVLDLLARTSVPADAVWMLIDGADGYTESYRLDALTADHLLATHLNGEVLTSAHGFPARFIFPGHYGMKQPKWVTRIRFSAQDQPGYWEDNGWDERAVVKTMSRIDSPVDGAQFTAGSVRFAGIAFAGDRRVSVVEVSPDGAKSWHAASLQPEFSPYSWRFWSLELSLHPGHHVVQVRARDGAGVLQTAATAPTLPDGAAGYHAIAVDVG
jgi:DMSO/TMAO reductase YedYZ molybdopterin-dependent catalytic subunit